MQRKVVIPNDFITDLAQIEQRPAQFEACYNATALPRAWNFTRTDLDALLCRIAEHEATSSRPLARLTPRRCGGAEHLHPPPMPCVSSTLTKSVFG